MSHLTPGSYDTTQLLSLIPWQGIVGSEGESILLLIRAIRYAVILVALIVGLPSLAQAHSGHDHQQTSVGQRVQLDASFEAVPSVPMVAVAEANIENLTKASSVQASRHVVISMSQDTSMHACAGGGCCCSGAAGCGAGSCCPTFIPSTSAALHIPAAAELVTSRLYHSASLLVILGLDRPPKA